MVRWTSLACSTLKESPDRAIKHYEIRESGKG